MRGRAGWVHESGGCCLMLECLKLDEQPSPYCNTPQVVTVNRFSRFASKLVSTVETMDAERGGAGGPGFDSGWGGSGGGSGASDWND